MKDNEKNRGTGLKAVLGSLLAGAIGVQSKDNWERDFSQGRFRDYVIGGIIFTALFVFSIIGMVNWLIASSQA
jgi:hypothetical protein